MIKKKRLKLTEAKSKLTEARDVVKAYFRGPAIALGNKPEYEPRYKEWRSLKDKADSLMARLASKRTPKQEKDRIAEQCFEVLVEWYGVEQKTRQDFRVTQIVDPMLLRDGRGPNPFEWGPRDLQLFHYHGQLVEQERDCFYRLLRGRNTRVLHQVQKIRQLLKSGNHRQGMIKLGELEKQLTEWSVGDPRSHLPKGPVSLTNPMLLDSKQAQRFPGQQS